MYLFKMKEAGYVYILTNPSFKEDWVKIGKSSRPVDIRSKELDNTAVPLPFEIYATLKTVKYSEVELQLHRMIDRLTDIRIRPNREFFNIAPNKALELLTIISTTLDDAEIDEVYKRDKLNIASNVLTNKNVSNANTNIESNSSTRTIQLDFWTRFNEIAPKNQDFIQLFRLRKPYNQNWYDLSIGCSTFRICLTASTQNKELTAGLYFSSCKDIYEKFLNKSHEIEDIIGEKIEWINKPNNKDARFLIRRKYDINEIENWDNEIAWLYEKCIQLYKISKLNNI